MSRRIRKNGSHFQKITLGKFAEIVGLSLHDSARLLDSMGIDVELGPKNSKAVEKEVEVAEGIV